MTLIRSSLWSAAHVAVAIGCLLICPAPVRAQTYVELGGGWNYPAPALYGERFTHGFNIRAAIGRQFAPRLGLRIDAFTSQFEDGVLLASPASVGINGSTGYAYDVYKAVGIAGVTLSALLNVDQRGILYLVGGTGFYSTYGRPYGNPGRSGIGVTGGAGIAVPVGARLRAFVEVRDYALLASGSQPPWIVPITLGLRY